MTTYITYFRQSTQRQGQSGLGLDAQRVAVAPFADNIIAEYVETESGKKNDRPLLAEALAHAKREGATLLIAKLDRLARNVAFIANLLEANVPITCADMPEADRTMLQMMSVFAEFEGRRISERTKDALAAAKRRGIKLGSPNPHAGGKAAGEARRGKTATVAGEAMPIIKTLRQSGVSFAKIATTLNDARIPSAMGGVWHSTSVRNLVNRETLNA